MVKTILIVMIVILLVVTPTFATVWSSTGEFAEGIVYFYYDTSGIWNQTGDILYPNTGTDINTSGYYWGDGSKLTNIAATSVSDIWLNSSGDKWAGDQNVSDYKLTNVGEIIMNGTITSKDIKFVTHNLFSIGDSTNWAKEAFITDIYSKNINASQLNATNINTTNLASDNVYSESMFSDIINIEENVTIGDHIVRKKSNGNLAVVLG